MVPLKNWREHVSWPAGLALDRETASEDPLAIDYLSQQVGNWLLPHLTTRTSSAKYFLVVLFGIDLVHRPSTDANPPKTERQRIELFERWERLWAMAVLTSRNGEVRPGDEDAMRGLLGARRAWSDEGSTLPLDYPLISRQSELGGLGAYLSSLRSLGLVQEHAHAPTKNGADLVATFLGEGKTSTQRRTYIESVIFGDSSAIPFSSNGVKLKTLGEVTRLSSIRDNPEQQRALGRLLFDAPPKRVQRQVARLVLDANLAGRTAAREVLQHAIQALSATEDADHAKVLELCRFALAYGDVAAALLHLFDGLYETLLRSGYQAELQALANDPELGARVVPLLAAVGPFLDQGLLRDFERDFAHTPAFVRCASDVQGATNEQALLAVVALHLDVQKAREFPSGWLRWSGDTLLLQKADYRPRSTDPERLFPRFKFDVVRRLLIDVGRLPRSNSNQASRGER